VAEVARPHEMNPNRVFLWRRQYQGGDLALPDSEGPKVLPVIVSDLAQDVAEEESVVAANA
jgi:transposase-like protein